MVVFVDHSLLVFVFFFLRIRRPPRSTRTDTLFPDPTLFRSFKAVKMRIGKPDIGEDVERVAAVRAAIGDRVGLMVDANQGLSVAHAIRLGRRLESFVLVWVEEPEEAYDLEEIGWASCREGVCQYV